MATSVPSKFRVWQYGGTAAGLEKSLTLNTINAPPAKPDRHQVQIIATSLNPVDYKLAEIALVRRLFIPNPATPGLDFAGRIVDPAHGSSLKPGQLVFGACASSPLAGSGLSEYASIKKEGVLPIPQGVDTIDAATIAVAGLTAYQSLVPKVKKGDKVLINGGSGGCGVFGIQIAKALGCYVATTCSSRNLELCQSIGADQVVDYTKQNIVEVLKGQDFDHVVDNVGGDLTLYWRAHEYTRPGAVYVQPAGDPSLRSFFQTFKIALWPAFLGGAQRKREGFLVKLKVDQMKQIVDWMKEGKVKAVLDTKFKFEDAPKAVEKLKTGRARGKIVVEVCALH